MSTRRRTGRLGATDDPGEPAEARNAGPDTTGRYIVLLREDSVEGAAAQLADRAGITAATLSDAGAESAADVAEGNVILPNIGVAVVEMDPDQFGALSVSDERSAGPVVAAEPEQIMYAIGDIDHPPTDLSGLTMFAADFGLRTNLPSPPASGGRLAPDIDISAEYLRGYRDSVAHLVEQLVGDRAGYADTAVRERAITPAAWNESQDTWGLQATGVVGSRYSGRGVKVAVLDTGFGPHADFTKRNMLARSFVPGQTAADGHGHGTHCIGTACGPRRPGVQPRYGVAYESDILVGKVLSNQGSGADAGILAGIDWAVANGVQVISMSLGARVTPGTPFSPVYEGVARRALARGTLIVAAAGNDSQRPAQVVPVSRPANCPSILAVAALDPTFDVSSFSNGGVNPNGGEVNIAAPGRDVYSSWPMPPLYRRLAGTSMATPHVAGITALFAQATGASGIALWQVVARSAQPLKLPRRDVGVGLVRAR
jgi:subtilisin family serine protease